MQHYQAILFDFDGTLFDTWPGLVSAYQKTHQHFFDCDWHPLPAQDVLLRPRETVLHNMLGRLPTAEEVRFFIDTYQEMMLTASPPFPGVIETLTWLNQQAIPWGIASNKPQQHLDKFTSSFPILKQARCLLGTDTIYRRKPEPDLLLAASAQLTQPVDQILYVGDHEQDLQAAQACGMGCVFAAYGYQTPQRPIDHYPMVCALPHTLLGLVDLLTQTT